ncbi:MAG: hypothetical protein ABIO70_18885 [Pseudomonadota bacterium]
MRTCTRSHVPLGLPQIETMTLELQARFIGARWREFSVEEADLQAAGGAL